MSSEANIRRTTVLYALSAAALLTGLPAYAQSSDRPVAAAAPRVGELEEVLVTARRREERLQDVPIAVTAVTAQSLLDNQVTTARQLMTMVPSLNINTGNQRDVNRYSLRGQSATVLAGEAVTVYFAEAPASQYTGGGPGMYLDLANVQVLAGPQGTLFGRNTTGGAVLFTPQRPSNEAEGFLQVGAGNYSNREATGMVNLALAPGIFSVRLAGEIRQRDGFTTQLSDGSELDKINYVTLRGSALFTPNEKFENYFTANYTKSDTGGTGIIITTINPTGPGGRTFGLANLQAFLDRQKTLGVRVTQGTATHWWQTKNVMAVNKTTFQLTPDIAIKNIASYARTSVSGGFDDDGTSFPILNWVRLPGVRTTNPSASGDSFIENLTEELQVTGNSFDHQLNWVAGGYYSHAYPFVDHMYTEQTAFGSTTLSENAIKQSSKAVFAQGTLGLGIFGDALQNLKLTLGYRYTQDTRTSISSSLSPVTTLCTAVATCGRRQDGEFAKGTYNVSLDYKVTPTILLYATANSGFKSGGFNAGALTNANIPAVFLPESVKNYEAGMKADFHVADRPVRLNMAAFYDDYKDIQRFQTQFVNGATTSFLTNASVATIKGFEATMNAKPTDNIEVSLNYSYLNAVYGKYLFPDAKTSPVTIIDLAGTDLPSSPHNKLGGSIKYHFPVSADVGDISVFATASYISHYRSIDQEQPDNLLGDYTLATLGANWRHIGGRPLDLEVYVTNLFDKVYIAGSQTFYYSFGVNAVSYGEPRMIGARLRYNFGG